MKVSAQRVRSVLEQLGIEFKEKDHKFTTSCPSCGKDYKCDVSKRGGSTICYSDACEVGLKSRPFDEWYSDASGLTIAEARSALGSESDPLPPEPSELGPEDDGELPAVSMPPGSLPLDMEQCERGRQYLDGRGISREVADAYGVTYDFMEDGVVFPISTVDGDRIVGWQRRAINPSSPKYKVMSSTGLQRARCVMFADRLNGSDHAIVCEGPFDALKFHLAGGNVATLGKVVTDQQLEIIAQPWIKRVYLALDDDAGVEMWKLCGRLHVPIFRPLIPAACRDRCEATGKKADFGECTMEEALQAFRDAEPIDPYSFA